MRPACPICMDGSSNKMISCFSGCSFDCCLQCFNKILKLNELDLVEFSCPQCRRVSVKGVDRRFSNFIKNNNRVLRRVNQLYEDDIRDKNNRLLAVAWNQFRYDNDNQINNQIVMDGLTNDEIANIFWTNIS